MKAIITIDPGKNGGIAAFIDGVTLCLPMPGEAEQIDTIRKLTSGGPAVCVMEKVTGYIPGLPQGGSAMFNFGGGDGYIRGALAALGIRTILVPPQKWQKDLGLGKTKKPKTKPDPNLSEEEKKALKKANESALRKYKVEWKQKLHNEAARRYPGLKVTKETCDALLILDWAKANNIQP